MIPIGEDAKSILSGEFSETIEITFNYGAQNITIQATGIFDETYEEVDPDTGAIVMSKNPRVTIYAKDIEEAVGQEISEDIEDNWLVVARGRLFRIKSVQKDGTGVAYLPLKKS